MILEVDLSTIMAEASAYSWVEWTAVVTAVLYLVLATRESIWCWPNAIVSSLLFAWVFFNVKLYLDGILNLYYVAMGAYGWIVWRPGAAKPLRIRKLSLKTHLILLVGGSALAVLVGWLFDQYTETDFAYPDAFTTVFAFIATVLVARKVLENWLYWIVIDLASIALYYYKDLHLTMALFIGYVIVAVYGYIRWRNTWRQQSISQ